MKIAIFFIASLFFSSQLIAQAPKSNVVVSSMPEHAEKLSREQVKAYVGNNNKLSGIPLDKENYYKVDGLIISFWDLHVNPDFQKTLKASQSEIEGVFKLPSDNVFRYSKIITVNGKQFLVYQYDNGDVTFLRFQSEYNKNNENICGLIQCKKSDEDKAQQALQTFLSTVHFKE